MADARAAGVGRAGKQSDGESWSRGNKGRAQQHVVMKGVSVVAADGPQYSHGSTFGSLEIMLRPVQCSSMLRALPGVSSPQLSRARSSEQLRPRRTARHQGLQRCGRLVYTRAAFFNVSNAAR